MPRPRVQVNQPNICDTLLAQLHANLPGFEARSGIIGITLNGGLSRGYGDHLSEIDITFYLESDTYEGWQQGKAPYGNGIQRIDGELYDIKFVDFAQEDVATWSSDARWDASYAQALYDPNHAISQLLAENEAYRPSPSDASGVMFSAWWHYKLAGDIWIYRDDPLQTHFMLNQSITEIIKAIFMANKEFVPHEKWLVHMSRTLDWTPTNWLQRLTQIMCDLSPTTESVKHRQSQIEELWGEVDQHIVSTLDKPYPLNIAHKWFFDLLSMLAEKKAISIERWRGITDLSMLNNAPFNLCTTITNDQVIFNTDKCVSLTSEDLYSWHFEIVRAVQETLLDK